MGIFDTLRNRIFGNRNQTTEEAPLPWHVDSTFHEEGWEMKRVSFKDGEEVSSETFDKDGNHHSYPTFSK